MEIISGNIISELPFGKITKVSDLVYFEGPILTHFIGENGENLLFHWVDFDEIVNRWLIIQVEEDELYYYLKNESSLKDLFDSKLNNFSFIVDIDREAKLKNIYLVHSRIINPQYVPDNDSYFNQEISFVYEDLIKKNEPFNYFYFLKNNAFYLKLKPTRLVGDAFGKTVSTEDVVNFLHNLNSSVINFAKIKLSKSSSFIRINNKIEDQLKEQLTPRIVDLKYSSFCVGLSIDTNFQKDEQNIINNVWKKEFIDDYKYDVIDAELENDEVLKRITEKYTPIERHLIYDPFVKATNSNNYYVIKTNKFNKDLSEFRTLPPKKEKILLPVETKIEIPKIITERIAKVEITEGKVKPKVLGLFDEQINSILYDIVEVKYGEKKYKLKYPLSCKYELSDKEVFLENHQFGIFASGDTLNEAIEMFSEEFDFIYNRYNELPDDKLTNNVKLLKHNLNDIVIK